MRLGKLWLLLVAAPAAAAGPAVHQHRLDNGMEVIVAEDHRAPVAVSMVWYRVGSSYEHDGITGISHVLEHMMFKGTESLAPGEFSEIIAANGGKENAFTSRDYTAYFQQIAADRLEIALKLEADRMRNLRLLPEEFAKEREVVKEERRLRTDDKPTSVAFERFNAVAFLSSPYRYPVIGWMEDLSALTLADLQAWYERWYAPNNATLVVAGDVDALEVVRLAEKYFGPHRPSGIEPPKPRTEVPHMGERRITVEAPAKQPYLLIGYKTPSLPTAEVPWEPYALEVLASILGDGSASRLQAGLVRGREVAASVDSGYDLAQRMSSLLMFDAVPAKGRSVEDVERALAEEIRRIQTDLVSEEELERVKAQVIAGDVYKRDSTFAQAMEIGRVASIGLDLEVIDRYVEAIRRVTPEQVRAVARKYLVEDGRTVAILVPEDRRMVAGKEQPS